MVDHLAPDREKYEVVEEGGRALNSNLICDVGNHNKYYILQVLKASRGRKRVYKLYRRWGRCGTDGRKVQKDYDSLEEVAADYDALLESKLDDYSEVNVDYSA
eukprot:TRINITY_DN3283_c0_g1_i7.p1 TRINITY_DN3283_c0_g1~~TRINITY_DN3283_c0_g1_i7.p1  ORF type:complete len:103 (+),score=34.40 TRINITY_DN3283_c0_g1_i7:110-418(+)